MKRVILAFLMTSGVVAAALLVSSCGKSESGNDGSGLASTATNTDFADAHYIGAKRCAECHEKETELWHGSHHQQAMAAATEETVLGNFNEQSLEHYGSVTRFFRRDGKFWVHTAGADGREQDFEVSWVFGVEPLQQYLVDFSDGRKQVLPYCWDSRPAEDGGQRWFHIHPDEAVPPGDLLHWTKSSQNWNFMCAECHSTGLVRAYDEASDTFATHWQEVNVACEACHGPGSAHVQLADAAQLTGTAPSTSKESSGGQEYVGGWAHPLKSTPGAWSINAQSGKPERTPPLLGHQEVNTCAPCHSRRSPLTDGYTPGAEFLDQYMPSLLEPMLYHADGQIEDEVYVWGSFVQSKMYHAGVSCSDCHDAHSLEMKFEGDALCLQCHPSDTFATKQHHGHTAIPGDGFVSCVDCHMPETTYMVVDPRRDHSMRVPRPDLSVSLGTPNACNGCHDDQNAQWAADAIQKWVSERPDGSATPWPPSHYATALHKGREGAPGAQQTLRDVAADPLQPAMARASALVEYSQRAYAGLDYLLASAPQEEQAPPLLDADPLLRLGAAQAAAGLEPELQMRVAVSLLIDPSRAVRHEAVRQILPFSAQMPKDSEVYDIFQKELASYQQTLEATLDRPGTRLNRGLMYMDLGQPEKAEAEYRAALKLESHYVPAAINLADLMRNQQRDQEGEEVLTAALAAEPGNADLLHSLGLLQVRLKRQDEAVKNLQAAAAAAPNNARYALVLGVAFESYQQMEKARAAYSKGLMSSPWDPELLLALFRLNFDAGDKETAKSYADRFLKARPDHPLAADLRQAIAE